MGKVIFIIILLRKPGTYLTRFYHYCFVSFQVVFFNDVFHFTEKIVGLSDCLKIKCSFSDSHLKKTQIPLFYSCTLHLVEAYGTN